MNNHYTFTTETGWRVHEYRPLSLGYEVLNTPCLSRYGMADRRDATDDDSLPSAAGMDGDILSTLTNQKLKFDSMSAGVIRQLLEERVALRNSNHSSIMGRIADISSQIPDLRYPLSPLASRDRQTLDRLKLDLERQAREEDLTLWRDALELRRELVLAAKTYEGAKTRADLIAATDDEHKETWNPVGSGYVPGTKAADRKEG